MIKTGKNTPCFNCGKSVYIYPSRKMYDRHFCSRECRYKAQKKYQSEINKSLKKRVTKICNFCKKQFEVHAYRKQTAIFCSTSCKGKFFSEEKHSCWKGGSVGYQGVHHWIRKHKGLASKRKCVFCSKQAKEWANIDGKYRRRVSDYISLCVSCHRRYDS